MVSISSLKHIRLPFSFFLLPIFLLAVLTVGTFDTRKAIGVFIVLHFFLYTASNGFNSYYDKDIESIGTLRYPPQVTKDLLWFSLLLDGIALAWAFIIDWRFAVGCFIYGGASKAYSWDKIRIKKHAVWGWLITGLGQGTLTFFLVAMTVAKNRSMSMTALPVLFPAVFTGVFILGFFPLTQMYQHAEDARRKDITISLKLGIRKTLLVCVPLLGCSLTAFAAYFLATKGLFSFILFIVFSLPGLVYFLFWFSRTMHDERNADYVSTMKMSVLATGGITLFCIATLIREIHLK